MLLTSRAFGLLKRRFACIGEKMRTSLRNTKTIIVAAAVLHNLAVAYRVPEPDVPDAAEYPDDPTDPGDQDDPDDPDDPRAPVQPQAVRNIQGSLKRQQIIRDYFT